MVISVASQKGGTGKTTTSISLAAGLARRGKKTLLIDTDSQANSSKVICADYQKLTPDQTLYWLTINAFTASDKVLVVVSPGYFELDSIVQISKTIAQVRDNFNPRLELAGFLFTMSDQTINSETSLRLLRQSYTGQVLTTIIPLNVDIRDAHFQKQDIFAFNQHAKAAQAYERLIKEL